MRYGCVIERTETGYSAYVPELPGCIATGPTESLVRQRLQEAVEIHLKSMMEDGDPIPEPTKEYDYTDMTKPRKRRKAGRSGRLLAL
jgi:predicted RNase H-like HicB family nuclease